MLFGLAKILTKTSFLEFLLLTYFTIMMKWVLIFVAFIAYGQPTTLKLSQALQGANEHHPLLKRERINPELAQADLQKAKLYQNLIFNIQYLQLLPSSMYYDRNVGPLHAYNSQDWFQLTKKFQILGQRENKIEMAKLQYAMAETELSETRRQVLFEVSNKWVDAWSSLAYKNLTLKAADYLDQYLSKNYDSIQAKYAMSAEEILRFEILDDQYDLELSRAEQDYYTNQEALKLLTGRKESISIDINDTSETVSFQGVSFDSLLQIAQRTRHDLKVATTFKTYSEYNQRYQRSLAIPSPEGGLVWNPQNTIPYLGIYFTQTLPLFDRNQNEIQKAKLLKTSANIEYDVLSERLVSELRVAHISYKRKKEMVAKFRHNLNDSERLLQLVREKFKQSKTSVVDLWEAEQTWFQTYQVYYQSFADYRKSYIELLYQLNMLDELK
jgi:outer membrane protein, heavy metal efflux system